MSWEIGLARSPMLRQYLHFEHAGGGMVLQRRQVFNSSTTSFQLRLYRRLPKFRSMTQITPGRVLPLSERLTPISTRWETCMLFYHSRLCRETNQWSTLITFRPRWYSSNSYLTDRRTPEREKVSVIPSAPRLGFDPTPWLTWPCTVRSASKRHPVQWTPSSKAPIHLQFMFLLIPMIDYVQHGLKGFNNSTNQQPRIGWPDTFCNSYRHHLFREAK